MPTYATAGAAMGRPLDGIKSIEFHKSNILTSASFTPPPKKSWLDKLFEKIVETLTQAGNP